MANMNHCRFQNTKSALSQIVNGDEGFAEDGLSDEEHNARVSLIKLMIAALDECGCDVDSEYADTSLLQRK